jgi:hypothetical protein
MDAQSYFLCTHNESTYLLQEKNENRSATKQKKKGQKKCQFTQQRAKKAKKLSF